MNKFKNSTIRFSRTYAIGVLTVALVLVCVFASFCGIFGVADAVSPDGYLQDVDDKSLDWYMAKDYLDLATLKKIVAGWFSSSQYDFSSVKPVVVAVIDSGINYNHEQFCGKYDENGVAVTGDGIGEYDVLYRDESGNIIGKNTVLPTDKNYVSSGYSVLDDAPDRHGTHVAGILATFIHELNLEKYIKIMPVKAAYPTGSTSTFSSTAFNDGVKFALSSGADVVNMSLASDSENFSISSANSKRAVFVAAAGNGEKSLFGTTTPVSSDKKKYYPAACDGVIGVMNYTKDASGNKILSSTSNYGSKYDLCAPGTDYMSADGKTNDGYKKLGGTSMACPVVSFGAALAILQDRAKAAASGETLMTYEQIAKRVKTSLGSKIQQYGSSFGVFDLCELANDSVRVQIKCDSDNLTQDLSDVKDVTLSLVVSPFKFDNLGKVEWFEINQDGSETRIAFSTFKIDYSLEKRVFSTTIYAKWTYKTEKEEHTAKSERVTISVNYVEYTPEQISKLKISALDGNGSEVSRVVCQAGEEYTFKINDFMTDYVSPMLDVQWYVNGVLKARGTEFVFVPSNLGTYTVTAKIDGHYTNGVEINVDIISEQTADVLKIFTIVASAAIAAAFAVTMCVIVARKRKSK